MTDDELARLPTALVTAYMYGDTGLVDELLAELDVDQARIVVCGLAGFVAGMIAARVEEAASELGIAQPPAALDVWRDYLARAAARRDAG